MGRWSLSTSLQPLFFAQGRGGGGGVLGVKGWAFASEGTSICVFVLIWKEVRSWSGRGRASPRYYFCPPFWSSRPAWTCIPLLHHGLWVVCCLLRNSCWGWSGAVGTLLGFQSRAGAEHQRVTTGQRAELSEEAGTLQTCPLVPEAQEGACLLPPSEGLGALCFFIRPQFIH